ncbi:MAG: CPBP family intramembrane metalloprotease [Flavobacteriales bacterium]|jgi:hypothetical protein|nr:CPBP family intramembrane metalloprotease [Flavobacteriales bacterium]
MKKQKTALGFILFGLGVIGILSILTMDIPLPPEAEAILSELFTPFQIKLLTLINPTILLSIAVLIGTVLYQKVNFSVPLIEQTLGIKKEKHQLLPFLKYGATGGIIAGVLLSIISWSFTPILPTEFIELGENLQPSIAARFLYGGITEEILMRFGLMTLITWIAYKIFGNSPITFWIGIIIAAIVFALGHFPIAYQAVGTPSAGLLTYILIGNTTGGIIFGWLYWKKGLESAIIAHIFAHVTMLVFELF